MIELEFELPKPIILGDFMADLDAAFFGARGRPPVRVEREMQGNRLTLRIDIPEADWKPADEAALKNALREYIGPAKHKATRKRGGQGGG